MAINVREIQTLTLITGFLVRAEKLTGQFSALLHKGSTRSSEHVLALAVYEQESCSSLGLRTGIRTAMDALY